MTTAMGHCNICANTRVGCQAAANTQPPHAAQFTNNITARQRHTARQRRTAHRLYTTYPQPHSLPTATQLAHGHTACPQPHGLPKATQLVHGLTACPTATQLASG